MLDINLFRTEKGGDPEIVRESQRRRYADVSLVDKVIELDTEWRGVRFELDQLNKEFNSINKEVATVKKAGGDATELFEKSKECKNKIQETEEKEKEVIARRDKTIVNIGNIVHDSVPVDQDEANNVIVRTFGEPRMEDKLWGHYDLVQLLDIVNMTAGVEVAGARGYYLTNEAVFLNQALITYAMHFLHKRSFKPVHTPFFMKQDIMAECAQLSQFDEELYKVTGEGEDKYLIATSEQTLCAMHRKQWYEKTDLPMRMVGYSTCFRKEAGSHGRDTLGIFRIHQFEKVEQFCITSPEGTGSWEMMEEMLNNSEQFYQSLGLPYRVVNIVSGELNNAAAKKYDLEAWFPGSKAYRELVSCSNCTDYQSRRLDVRLRTPKNQGGEQQKLYVHLLNSTLTATERTICCILENGQTPDGVKVPDVLLPFMPPGMDFIPFRKSYDAKGKLVDRVAATPAPSTPASGQ